MDIKKQEEIKRLLGARAAELVEEGMVVGLGTGSTASCFIDSLIERCKQGLKIVAVSSSINSMEQAKKGSIPVVDMEEIRSIDLTIDGADEVDPQKRLIKGGGGAHVREKILASTSKKMVVIIDESKLVKVLGKVALPVEILTFGFLATISKIEALGYKGKMRKKGDGFFITDNGNYIYDIDSPNGFRQPEVDNMKIIQIPGVVDTGFFFNLASEVLVGYDDGKLKFLGK